MESNLDPQEALNQVAEANRSVADRLITPIWYHPVLGLLAGGFVVAYSLGSTPVRVIDMVVYLAGILALKEAYQRITGVWISGFRAGRASIWAAALGVTMGLSFLAAMILAGTTDRVPPVVGVGVVLLVATVVIGRRFDEAVRQQLRSAP